MRISKMTAVLGAAAVVVSAQAGVTTSDYSDSTGDLFDNGFTNLDITNVSVWNDANYIHFAVTTAAFSNWTKYAIFLSVPGSGPTGAASNPWGRPHNSDTPVNYFMGSWVDQGSDNMQVWNVNSAGWAQTGGGSNSVSGNTVTFSIGFTTTPGSTILFDVGTSGGGADPFVDLLSRSDQSTSGWGSASNAGTYRSYTFTGVPAPGAIALLGLAGMISRRRR